MKRDISATPAEMERARKMIDDLQCPAKLPYSFNYGGKLITVCEDTWKFESVLNILDGNRTEYVTKLSDPETGLVVTCNIIQYNKYPAMEWTVWFENTSGRDTPIISNIKAVDKDFVLPYTTKTDIIHKSPDVKICYFKGDFMRPDGYEPAEHYLYDNYDASPLTQCPCGGRPTDRAFPYYRIQGESSGMLFVVSWQGQWEVSFLPAGDGEPVHDTLHITAGQQLIHTKLLPGEKIRTPMIFVMPYDGTDSVRAQNLWRRWFIEFNMPRVNGGLIKPFYANSSARIFHEMVHSTEENQKQYVEKFLDNGVQFDYLWMDAGWYYMESLNTNESEKESDAASKTEPGWYVTGTWQTDKKRFPNGIREISDYVHKRGIKTILWFEPERVKPGTELATEHPDWCLFIREGLTLYNPEREGEAVYLRHHNMLLDLGNAEALEWITDRINNIIRSEGIDLYRQDFNIAPLLYWLENDEPDRQGIHENHYCTGYLKMWDSILAANPGIIIDSCASGGRRNDLETMRRSLPLHKTDYDYGDLTAKHGMHHTLFQWLPFFGSFNVPGNQGDIYYHRSSLLMSYHGCENVFADDFDFKKLSLWMQEWRETAHCMYGDYYPLTPYSRDDREWIGWQFNLPDRDEGMVQIFMRPESPYIKGVFKLEGLDPDTVYELKDYNTGEKTQAAGKSLMDNGIEIVMRKRPDSALYYYKAVEIKN